jgi:predicted phage tail protein
VSLIGQNLVTQCFKKLTNQMAISQTLFHLVNNKVELLRRNLEKTFSAFMSDKGSQNGSIRAGYRRSRMEPVDPTTITAPPPAVSPNGQTRPPSTGPKKEDEQKEGIFKKIVRVIFLVLNIIFMTFAILMIFTGVIIWIIFREAGLSILDVAGGLPLSKLKEEDNVY